MTISVVLDPPTVADSEAVFNAKAFALLGSLNTWAAEANVTQSELNAAKIAFDAAWSAAYAAGLPQAAANALAAQAAMVAAQSAQALAATSANSAIAAWSAALAANPDINPWGRMNPSQIAENITLAASYNAVSAGPITVADGNTITVDDGAHWTIV